MRPAQVVTKGLTPGVCRRIISSGEQIVDQIPTRSQLRFCA